MSGVIQKIKIEDIINYYENPRHVVGDNEQDTLKKLFDSVGIQYMFNLAEDIKKYGLLGNQQIVVVYSENMKKYVVYEGNRRVAAMKMLLNPDYFLFLDKANSDKAKKLAEDVDIIETLECYVTDEEEAFFIMERTHSGEDKGRGVKQWTSREKEVFKVRQSQNNEKKISYLIYIYVKKHCEELDITTILPFTTIQRIFNNREIRKQIGLDVADERTFTLERMKLIVEASKWIEKEAETKGVGVTRLYNKSRTVEDKLLPWIKEYQCLTAVSKTNIGVNAINDKEDFKQSENAKDNQEDDSKGKATTRDSNISTGGNKNLPYFFQGLQYGSLDPDDVDTHGVTAVCRELQLFSRNKLVATYPLASAFLIRTIIEQAIKYYSKKHMIQGQSKYIWEDIENIERLSKIIAKYNHNLPNYIVDAKMRQYFTALFGNYEHEVDPLNWVIHRPAEFQLDANTLVELPRKGLLTLINFMLS